MRNQTNNDDAGTRTSVVSGRKEMFRRTLSFATTSLLSLGFVGLAIAPFGVAHTACADHTDSDTKNCSAICLANQVIGVSMQLDEWEGSANPEKGIANTTCSSQTASCTVKSGVDPPGDAGTGACKDESEAWTATSGDWACHFEAHDVWFQPDNGFNYNCYSYDYQGGGAIVILSAAPPSPSCSGLDPEALAQRPLLVDLCGLLNGGPVDGLTVSYAAAQILIRAQAGAASGLVCGAEATCEILDPVCRATSDGFACETTPA